MFAIYVLSAVFLFVKTYFRTHGTKPRLDFVLDDRQLSKPVLSRKGCTRMSFIFQAVSPKLPGGWLEGYKIDGPLFYNLVFLFQVVLYVE